MNKILLPHALQSRLPGALIALTIMLAFPSADAQVALADQPATQPTVAGNLLLSLSVEYPTAIAVAYPSTIAYNNQTANPYVGYFDPAKCYVYITAAVDAVNGPYFQPYSAAPSQTCASTAAHPLWSGNWLNWVSMQSLDVFRWGLTGGYRAVDTSSLSILEKAWSSNQGSGGCPTCGGDTPDKSTSVAADITGATPFTWATVNTRIWALDRRIWMTGSSGSLDASPTPTPYTNQYGAGAATGNIYELVVRVQVCDPSTSLGTAGVEANCTIYGSNYKPEGLMQQYAMNIRFAAMGYLNDPVDTRDGGVLRASMKYIGPVQPNPGTTNSANALAEWSSVDGTYYTNPSPLDITNSSTSPSPAVTTSGVMNYLNKFGEAAHSYKGYDPVGELYYAGVRYFENLNSSGSASGVGNPSPSPVPYVTGTGTPYTTGKINASMADGFPVVTTWNDPILYACQSNFILGIGDENTHSDSDVPGTALADAQDASAIPPDLVFNASAIGGAAAATNMVGKLEGLNLAGFLPWCCSGANYYMAGLAYFAHTTDLRPADFLTSDNLNADGVTKKYIQTASTYWLDVQEYQAYHINNQFYLATKYGGFTIPNGFQPFASANTNTSHVPQLSTTAGLIPMGNDAWYTNGHTQGGTPCDVPTSVAGNNDATNNGSSANCNWQPDNYFSALDGRDMVNGLQAAFSNIANGSTGFSTAFSAVAANINSTSGSMSYGSKYTPAPAWSGDVIGSTVVFDPTTGAPTLTQVWTAASILTGTSATSPFTSAATSRIIVTCCNASGSIGLPFEDSAMSSATFLRANYTSFANVPGVASASQSAKNYLNYLRGDRRCEIGTATSNAVCSTGVYRNRSSLLGDIVDSQITAVGPPSASYSSSFNPGYSTFVSTYASRKTVAYVGANDGMLHAFDGSSSGTGGTELFAYIPSFVYGCYNTTTCTSTATPSIATPIVSGVNGLASLGNKVFVHHNLVDSTPLAFDIDLNNAGGVVNTSSGSYTPKWATVLIGGLGKGGHGYYAIDVTDPTLWTSETAMAGKVLWEFTDSRMGDSYGTPTVVKTAQYGWVVIFTSGYNNTDGLGYFFIVNAATGALLQAVATNPSGASATNQSGLAHPTAYVNDYTNYTADSVYSGDLLGNVWRLDLTPASGSYSAPTLIATLADPSGNPQPVTTDPYPEQQPNTLNRYILVGTGRLLAPSDTNSTQIQTFYAIIDGKTTVGGFYISTTLPSGVTFPITRSNMVQNVDSSASGTSDLLTGITLDSTKPMGWYLDLTTDPTTGIAERIDVDPVAYYGIVGFAANLPTGSVCSQSGTSRVFATSYTTGQSALTSPTNSATQIAWSTAVNGLVTQLQFDNINGKVFLDAGSSTGVRVAVQGSWVSDGNFHRVNWREVPTAD